MTPLNWQDSWSSVAYDLSWTPLRLTGGLLRLDSRDRFAVLVGDKLGILAPDQDVAFAEHAARMVAQRVRGDQR